MPIAEPRNLIDVLARLEHWRREIPDQNMRTFRRFSVRAEAMIEPLNPPPDGPTMEPVMLRDISRSGIGFLASRFLERDSFHRIHFYDRAQRIGSQPACIRYCRMVQDGLYLVGAQFVIEPFVMLALGVEPVELADDIHDPQSGETGSQQFLAPHHLDESAD